MSKYEALWKNIAGKKEKKFLLTFAEIRQITGIPLDHSFLNCKKELTEYGYRVGKISMKQQTVEFVRIQDDSAE